MAERRDSRDRAPGLYDPAPDPGVTGIEITGAIVSVLWVALTAGTVLTTDAPTPGAAGAVQSLLMIVLPVALIWVAVLTTRAARMHRADSARLAAAVDALRQAYVAQAQSGRTDASSPALVKRLDEIAQMQGAMDARLTLLVSAHIAEGGAAASPVAEPAAQTAADDDQPALSLGTPAEALQPPLANADFIRAVHFPETAEDAEGFAALRRALRDRQAAHLIQAAQDVLTLLSQDGIYMDDLHPDLARPETWRAFAQGTRGRAVAALGGVHDRTSLALAAGRMKQDPIFRDAVHHFLRRFDKSLAAFEPQATDSELTDFAGTRTARAFMLLGRVAGTFD